MPKASRSIAKRSRGRRGHEARIYIDGRQIRLGQWPSERAALIAFDRAVAHFELQRPARVPSASRRLGPASPEQLRLEARKERGLGSYLGVKTTPANRYHAGLQVRDIQYYVGSFRDAKQAAIARDRAALYLKAKVKLNFPSESRRLGGAPPEQLRLAACAEDRRLAALARKRTSKFIGVALMDRQTRWTVQIAFDNTSVVVARFDDERVAAEMHDRVALHLWQSGRMSKPPALNFPKRKLSPLSVAQARAVSRRQEKQRTTSRFRGVHWSRRYDRWTALLQTDGKWRYLGRFDVEEEAARAYDKAALERLGTKAFPNFDPTTGEELCGNWRLADRARVRGAREQTAHQPRVRRR